MQETLQKITEIVNQYLGPLGSDGFTWETIRDFLIQIASTIILFLVVKFFFWNKVTAVLDERRKIIDSELTEAKESREKAKQIEDELKMELAAAQARVKEIISTAEKDGNGIRDNIIMEAKAEAKRRIDNANSEIENEIKEKNNEIKKLIVEVAFLAAKKIVSEEIDQKKYIDVVNEIIEGASK